MGLYSGNSKGLVFVVCFRIAHFFTQNIILYVIGCPIWILYRIVFNWLLGIDIHERTKIGKNFVIWHGMGLVVNPNTIIGNNVTLRNNTTIGNAHHGGKSPVICDGVSIGPNSVVIGDITIGENSIIGAGSVVVKNVDSYTVVAGNPAKIIKRLIANVSDDKNE